MILFSMKRVNPSLSQKHSQDRLVDPGAMSMTEHEHTNKKVFPKDNFQGGGK